MMYLSNLLKRAALFAAVVPIFFAVFYAQAALFFLGYALVVVMLAAPLEAAGLCSNEGCFDPVMLLVAVGVCLIYIFFVFNAFSYRQPSWRGFVLNSLEALLFILLAAQLIVFSHYNTLVAEHNRREPYPPTWFEPESYSLRMAQEDDMRIVRRLEGALTAIERYFANENLAEFSTAMEQVWYVEPTAPSGFGWTPEAKESLSNAFTSMELFEIISHETKTDRRLLLLNRLEAEFLARLARAKAHHESLDAASLYAERKAEFDSAMEEYEKRLAAYSKIPPPTLSEAYRILNPFSDQIPRQYH